MRKENIYHGHFVPVCDFWKSFSYFIGFSHSKALHSSWPLFIGIRSNPSISLSLYDEEAFHWNFFNGSLELFAEFFRKIVVTR